MMNDSFYQDKVRGCWFGKCLGGIAGMPFEGVPYHPALSASDIHVKDVPNDDLEMQLVWLDGLKQYGLNLDEKAFAQIWTDRIPHGCDEYSVAIRNLKYGILPPASGWRDNFFTRGMGATIRSEIWALVFPGRPDAAGYFAQQDAQVDHWGDGVRGEIFMATAESMACAGSGVESALRFALERLPRETEIHQTLRTVFALYDGGKPEEDARAYLLSHFGHHPNFTDCVMNLAFIVFALLYGKGDFLKTILLAVNCGRDTDCTGASCGAFLGIALGMKAMPKEWLHAVREELCLSDYVTAIPGVPATFSDLVKQTVEIHQTLFPRLKEEYPPYTPYEPDAEIHTPDTSTWLILKDAENPEELESAMRNTGTCPEEHPGQIVTFDGLNLDLSAFADDACTLDLYTFLHVENTEVRPEETVLSATADTGMTLWVDRVRVMNHHSRLKMIPSFHRAEGGAAFVFPLRPGEKKLIHLRLYYCLPPLRACVMFGNLQNDHLTGFRMDVRK